MRRLVELLGGLINRDETDDEQDVDYRVSSLIERRMKLTSRSCYSTGMSELWHSIGTKYFAS